MTLRAGSCYLLVVLSLLNCLLHTRADGNSRR